MKIEVSVGEILDKISILKIKSSHISDKDKLKNINRELNYLEFECELGKIDFNGSELYSKLYNINKELWDIEDTIRDKERNKEFDSEFIELARSVYITNDKRAEIKKEINLMYKSFFIEEKSYSVYD
jgi:hypothetical protein